MKNLFLLSWLSLLATFLIASCTVNKPMAVVQEAVETIETIETIETGDYTIVIEGYDWGPAVSKVILSLKDTVSAVNKGAYKIAVERKTTCMELKGGDAKGERSIVYAYVSDAKGKKAAKGKFVTLVLSVSPHTVIDAPMKYIPNAKCRGNVWVDYNMTITNAATNQVWDKEIGRIRPLIDDFDVTGRFQYSDDLTMSYASFTPKASTGKKPLIIWLHGGGEGGTDPTVPLAANRAANYASDDIQAFFGGAYVLVPQAPGAWMHNTEGVSTWGKENDVYNEGLMALIKDYVAQHPSIDKDRIYLGGCSNGGYMTIKLMLLYPDYFAAGFPSALAYKSEYISEEQIQGIKDLPIWFIHAKDDPVTVASETAVPVYERLIAAGAKQVHLSYFDHVTDITGFFGGDNYHYNGHFSWIYSHTNLCKLDYDGQPVRLNGRPVTLMEWLASQKRGNKG